MLGQALREARERVGLTRGDVEELTQVSWQLQARMERGEVEPGKYTIQALSKVLGITSIGEKEFGNPV